MSGEQLRAGLLGVLVLETGTGHAPFELCLSRAAIQELRVLLARLEEAIDDNSGAIVREVDEGSTSRVPAPEFLPDDVDPGRTH